MKPQKFMATILIVNHDQQLIQKLHVQLEEARELWVPIKTQYVDAETANVAPVEIERMGVNEDYTVVEYIVK
tara:strand:+ start:1107 stop:1322 length:216 start_codon:yes stop_codon:yes gene_type:complete